MISDYRKCHVKAPRCLGTMFTKLDPGQKQERRLCGWNKNTFMRPKLKKHRTQWGRSGNVGVVSLESCKDPAVATMLCLFLKMHLFLLLH